MVRKKAVCFKVGKQLFGDNGLHSLRDERSDCNRAIVRRVRYFTFIGDREKVGELPRGRKNTKILGKLEKLVENRGELRGTGL